MELKTGNFAHINFKTIKFDTTDETNQKDNRRSINQLLYFLVNFKKSQNLVPKFKEKKYFYD